MPGEFKKRELRDSCIIVTYTVDNHHHGQRLDQFLRYHYKTRSRNQIQKAIEDGKVQIKGRLLKPATTLKAGMQIEVVTPFSKEEPAVNLNYKIMYQDPYVLIIDKPGNLPVHPAGRFITNTLLTDLRIKHADELKPNENFYLIHRLDRETSGLLVLAKQKDTARLLIEQFYKRKIEKRYFAVVNGNCKEKQFTVDAPIGPATNSAVRLKMAAYPIANPQAAVTEFKVLQRTHQYDLIDCKPLTGRQHQIRVHLAHSGYPLVGDKLYGNHEEYFLKYIEEGKMTESLRSVFCIDRHALHSYYLKFFHPHLGKHVEFESSLPEDMEKLIYPINTSIDETTCLKVP